MLGNKSHLKTSYSELNNSEKKIEIAETNDVMSDFTFVTVRFYNNTSQQEINNAINLINPVNHLMCPNNPYVYIMALENTPWDSTEETGRGSGSGSGSSSGETDDLDPDIDSIACIQYHTYGIDCN